jgi:hypothetical protein
METRGTKDIVATHPFRLGRWTLGMAVLAAACLAATTALAACPPTPDHTCRFSYKADLTYADSAVDTKDKLTFKLTRGAATTVEEFGDPTTTDGFDLCLYAGAAPVVEMTADADGDCSDKSCWKKSTKGPIFTDKTGTPNGITGIKLGAIAGAEKTSVVVNGKGANLPDLLLPLDAPLVVQVRNSLGNCWGAIFEPGQVVQDPLKRKLKAKASTKQIPSCTDAQLNGFETALDCGGPCAPCSYGESCEVDADCEGNVCAAGTCSAKRVFVTSTSHQGNFGGLAAADAECNARAAAANLGGTWTAWLSDGSTNAIDRIVDQAYWKLDGFKVFDDKAQITSTSRPTWGIDRNEFNVEVMAEQAWTGTNNAGASIVSNCMGWTTNASNQTGWAGWPATPSSWSAYGQYPCNLAHRFVCFEN